jgi:hypothetical protein
MSAVSATHDLWEPRWLEDGSRQLYAALHRPQGEPARTGVLIVPPLLHELQRSRRLCTQIAARLAAFGLPCLRFDFHGSGDSGGSGAEMDFASMRADLELAARALRRDAGVDAIVALALRGGALPLASWLAAGGHADAVVLWEPIVDGAAWLDQLVHDDAAELHSADRYPLRRGLPVERDESQLMGFDVSMRFRRDMAAAQVAADAWPARPALWGVLRADVALQTLPMQRVFRLPADAPEFGGSTRMDDALFVSPGLRPVVDALGQALRESIVPKPGMPALLAS